jgi:small multidrug resistance pump
MINPASTYLYLGLAIVAEVIATSSLKASDTFTRLTPTLVTLVGYLIAFWFLSLTIRHMPVGIVYGIWSGVGIVLIATVGWVWFKESLDLPAIIGLALIILGVLVVNLFSNSVSH